ncbi:MAG: phosphoribosylformylglycinamidine synthase [Proteobacteria bacterium]|nr:phosphoribosylformylglycinamidine synthase [Pseudomonadota bacterium]
MTVRIEVGVRPEHDDPRGSAAARRAQTLLHLPVERVRTRSVFKLAAALDHEASARICGALTDPVIEASALGALPLPDCDWIVGIGLRPGVTDNVGQTAGVFVADLLAGSPAALSQPPKVYTETLYLIWGATLEREQVRRLAVELLANPLIERIEVQSASEYGALPPDLGLPQADTGQPPVVETIALPDDDQALLALSRERTLALSRDELQAIRAYYQRPEVVQARAGSGLSNEPTDVELEALAQTWSEHCKHKIFNALIRYTDEHGHSKTIHSLFRSYIVETTRQVGQRVDWLVSVFHDNAGVVRIADDLYLVFKVETHNSPSALDPYGGAITGIVGVNRDPFGTGIGAALLANTWGYCLGSPFYDAPLPAGLLHPRRIRDGVHQGVIDGGNQSGLPYVRGFELFDDRFIGKPLVFCGTLGLMPAQIGGRPSESKDVCPGDVIVMIGGRIGKDGIHGATFSSEALHAASPAHAVQIGDPITQKRLTDMLLEARDAGLYRTLTDNGAGGLSSSVGEMARISGGAELELDRAPLKYDGLMPWEILLSEAQERMTLAVAPEHVEALLELARRREVEATPIGRFTADGHLRVRYADRLVADLELAFLHEGCPQLQLRARWTPPPGDDLDALGIELDRVACGPVLLALLASLDLCAKVDKCRQYDHEVKGLSVIKPLVGAQGDIPADAAVLRVRHGDARAVIVADAIAPRLSDLDPGAMAGWVTDLVLRRIIAAGGELGRVAALDNFCWPDPVQSASTPDGEQKLAGLVRCCESLHDTARALDLPLISGKDSMKNDSLRGGVKISIPPTLLLSAVGWIDDARRALDLSVPHAGTPLYVLGTTRPALGASALLAQLGRQQGRPQLVGRDVPRTSAAECQAACGALQAAIDEAFVVAAHAPHVGGLAVGLAMMALAADLGIEADLAAAPAEIPLSTAALLFAETPSRFIVAVAAERAQTFEDLCEERRVPWGRIGFTVTAAHLVLTHGSDRRPAIDLPLTALRAPYRETLRGV